LRASIPLTLSQPALIEADGKGERGTQVRHTLLWEIAGGQDRFWYDMALWTGIGTFVSALVAAIPGFVDYFTVALKSRARGMATAHMLLNLTFVALFVVAALMMANGGALSGQMLTWVVALHAIAVGLLAVSGVLGGEMVYRHHLGMVPDDREVERLEEEHHRVEVGSRR
jgi:uncharacterized membrane protein